MEWNGMEEDDKSMDNIPRALHNLVNILDLSNKVQLT